MHEASHAELRRLGATIRAERRLLKLSQEDFAERADIHRTYVGQIEMGKCNVSWVNISRIARALGTKPSSLLLRAGL